MRHLKATALQKRSYIGASARVVESALIQDTCGADAIPGDVGNQGLRYGKPLARGGSNSECFGRHSRLKEFSIYSLSR